MTRIGTMNPGRLALMLAAGLSLIGGCRQDKRVAGEVAIRNRWLGPMTVAVAPAINLSGGSDFDPDRFADIVASELGYADGISVVPVSRVLAVMASSGSTRVESPDHAVRIAQEVGAGAILVFAVTEYDPLSPPSIGISAQLYHAGRSARTSADRLGSDEAAQLAGPRMLSQVQRVYDASHESVADDIRRFAAARNADHSPWGWRRYVVNQQDFMRYCGFATIREILDGQHNDVRTDDNDRRRG